MAGVEIALSPGLDSEIVDKSARIHWPALLAALLLVPACSLQTENAIADLAAIHADTSEDGVLTHKEEAALNQSPTSYEVGHPLEGLRVGEKQVYTIEDSETLELELIDEIAGMNPGKLETSLEATAWLTVVLLHDEHVEARKRAAATLSNFAGYWIERSGARLEDVQPEGDLAAAITEYIEAVEAIDEPGQVERVRDALFKIEAAPIGDPLTAARLVAGMAGRYRSSPLKVTGRSVLERTGVRCVLMALEAGTEDADPGVAETCRVRHDLLSKHAWR